MVRVLELCGRGAAWPGGQSRAELGFHRFYIEIPDDAEDHIIRMNVALMPVEQILARRGRDGGVLRDASVGSIRAVNQFGCFAKSDIEWIVITARNAGVDLIFRQRDFVFTELRLQKQLDEHGQDFVQVLFEAVPVHGEELGPSGCFHFCGPGLEEVIELIAGLTLCAAGAPRLAKNLHQARFFARLVAGGAANLGRAANQGQFMVLEQKNHQAVR